MTSTKSLSRESCRGRRAEESEGWQEVAEASDAWEVESLDKGRCVLCCSAFIAGTITWVFSHLVRATQSKDLRRALAF